MCVVLDACIIRCVLNSETKCHDKFKPVLDLIKNNKYGKIIYGGKKYKEELKHAIGKKYLPLFGELERSGKVIILPDGDVNKKQAEVETLENHRDFDDPHLIAIIIVSGCKILCTNEQRAIKFIKDSKFYPKSTMRPKIYKDKRSLSILQDSRNIAHICRN